MKRSPRTHAEILETMERSRRRSRPRPDVDPWNEDTPLELFVSPAIKQRLNLSCRTTTEYLESLREEAAP